MLKVNERSMAQLNKQLINKDAEITNIKDQLEILRQKNIVLANHHYSRLLKIVTLLVLFVEELRDKKYKAVESVQQMEKNTKELIDKIEVLIFGTIPN